MNYHIVKEQCTYTYQFIVAFFFTFTSANLVPRCRTFREIFFKSLVKNFKATLTLLYLGGNNNKPCQNTYDAHENET